MAKLPLFPKIELAALARSYLLRRILLLGVLMSFAFSGLFSAVQSRRTYLKAKSAVLTRVSGMEEILEPQLELALWNLDSASAERALRVIAREVHVADVRIDGSGMTLPSFNSGANPDWTELRFPLVYESKNEKIPVGTLKISLTTGSIFESTVHEMLLTIFYNFIEFLVIGFFISLVFHQQVTLKILEIQRSSHRFNEEHLRPILGASLGSPLASGGSETVRLSEDIKQLQSNFLAAMQRQRETEANKIAVELQLERERQKVKLVQRLHSIGEIATHVAHDFANLMLVIRGNLNGMRTQLKPGDALHRYTDEIDKAIERAYSLVSKILSLTRVQEIKRGPFEPYLVLRDIEKLLRTAVGQGVEIDLRLDCQGRNVMADPAGLENSLINLCVNARDAMPDGGTIVISSETRKKGDELFLALSVQDSGPGVPENIREKIFEPFFTTKPPGLGSGLGLAQVSEFCREAHGSVELSSSDRGSVFTLLLPIQA